MSQQDENMTFAEALDESRLRIALLEGTIDALVATLWGDDEAEKIRSHTEMRVAEHFA